jgi:hypothetical protein
MKRFTIAIGLLASVVLSSVSHGANYTEQFTYDPGLTLYAFSFDEADFDDWVADRVAVTGGTTGLYSVTVDSANGSRFAIFEGATTPTSWDDAALITDITDRVAIDSLPTNAEFATALDPLPTAAENATAVAAATPPEAFFTNAPEGGGGDTLLVDTTVASVTSQTVFTLTSGPSINDSLVGQTIVLYDASNSDYPSVRVITGYVGSTRTVTINAAANFTVANSDGAKVFVSTFPVVGTGLANFQGFFNNGGASSNKTITNVTAPKNVTITVPQ